MSDLTGWVGPFRGLVERFMNRLDYALPYLATVAAQQADGSVDVRFDVYPQIADAQSVPVYYGVPGVSATFAAGASVIVEFAQADPSKPFVRAWLPGSTVTALNLGGETHTAALGEALQAWADALVEYIAGHIHPSPGGPTSAPTAPPVVPAPGTLQSSIVKVG